MIYSVNDLMGGPCPLPLKSDLDHALSCRYKNKQKLWVDAHAM